MHTKAALATIYIPEYSRNRHRAIYSATLDCAVCACCSYGFVLQIYTLNEAGLICDHKQIWTNMTAFQGIKLALTPRKRPE